MYDVVINFVKSMHTGHHDFSKSLPIVHIFDNSYTPINTHNFSFEIGLNTFHKKKLRKAQDLGKMYVIESL